MGKSGGFRTLLRKERTSVLLGMVAGVAACAQVEIGAHAIKNSTSESDSEERLAPVQVATDAEGYALWSGFKTVDGAWIAHPALPAPSQAYVRNSLNGRVIEAKLLRRDPTTPGPMILLSAEAARDLGIGPHRLTKVQIEVIGDSLPEAEVAEAPTAEVPEPAPTDEVSEAALAPVAELADSEAPAVEPQDLADAPEEPADAVIASQSVPEPDQQVASAPEISSQAAPEEPDVFRGDAPYQLQGATGGGDLAYATPGEPAPSATLAAAAPTPEPARSAPAPEAAKPAPAPAELTASLPPVASGEQRFVQVVSFTAEGSAAELATRLNALGHPALTDSAVAGDSTWHRVLIGPLDGPEAVERALNAARELGYADAFPTVRSSGSAPAKKAAVQDAPSRQPATQVTEVAAAQPAPAAAAPNTANVADPYVQVGSFTVQDNADNVAKLLKDRGLPSFTQSGSPGETRWHRVLIGPLADAAETAQALEAAKTLGHSDAFITRF